MQSEGTPSLRPATRADVEAIVRLNQDAVKMTSPMSEARCLELLSLSVLTIVAEVDGCVVGFVLTIGEGKPYDNGNYRWFSEKLRDFIYIDRVVIDATQRGAGLGQALYEYVCSWACRNGLTNVAAEIHIDPPNPASLKFHQRYGFVEIGTRTLEDGKRVGMQAKKL